MINKVNFNVIKEIQDKADIVAVISQFIKLNRKGNNYVSLCPFHADKNPSLVVSPKKKIFKCFVCNTKGNVFGFVQKYKKIPFVDAIKMVAKLIGYDDSQLILDSDNTALDPKIKRLIDLNKQVNEWYKGFLFNPENKDKLQYLSQRGLDEDIVKIFEFGYAPNTKQLIYQMATNHDNMFGVNRNKEMIWNEKEMVDAGIITITQDGKIYDFFSDRIMIPIYDNNGYLVAFSGRTTRTNIEPKYLNTSTTKLFNKSNVLFNFYKIKSEEHTKIIIVEGFMDAIAYTRCNHLNVVATMGVSLSNEHINALSTLNKLETIILSFDNDQAGVEATINNGQRLMENGFNVYVVAKYDKKIKDVDQLLNENGKSAVDQILDERIDFVTFLINNEFQSKKPLDEIQTSTNSIINKMISFGDNSLLLRHQHLRLLSEKSGLFFEDLKAKFDHDLQKLKNVTISTTYRDTFQPRIYRPTNDVGLSKDFIEGETDEQSTKPIDSQNNKDANELEERQKVFEKSLTDGYDKLIQNILDNPNVSSHAIDEINVNNANFNLVEQKYILKGIQLLNAKNLSIKTDTLMSFLEEKAQSDNRLANEYKKALIYFQKISKLQKLQNFGKRSDPKLSKEKLDQIVSGIQDNKYKILINKKILELWKIEKSNEPHKKAIIDSLNLQINDLKLMYDQFKNKKK